MRRDGEVLPQMLAAGEPLPEWAVEPPTSPWQSLYIAAYYDLNTERHADGWSIGPIPWSKIVAWGQWRGLRGDVLDAFVFVIRQMDAAYLKWEAAEMARKYPPKEK